MIRDPLIITPRLLPGARVGDGFISIEYAGARNGRQAFRYHLDIDGREYSADDVQSGAGGGTLQSGLAALLSFLGAAGESYSYEQHTGREGDNSDLFPAWVSEWAAVNSDELSLLCLDLEESGETLIQE